MLFCSLSKLFSRQSAMAVERPDDTPPPQPAAAPAPPVYVITLQHAEHQDSTLYRFEKGTTLRFCPAPSLLGRKVFLYTNYVVWDGAGDAEFVRNQYYGLEWRRAPPDADHGEGGGGGGEELGAGALLTDTDCCCELRLQRAGAFHFYFVYDTAECPLGPQGSGWFQVLPTLLVPLSGVMCQTVVSKCLGPLSRWRPALRAAHEAGYNMIHFTPIQELGASRSAYSIANQLRLDPRYGGGGVGGGGEGATTQPTFADVEELLATMRTDWNMMSISDVVLNHTANETAWLAAHPEAAYNARDCAHLRPAALLDAQLARLSGDVARGALHPAVPRQPRDEPHVDALRIELRRRLAALRLQQMFQCDVDALVNRFTQLATNKLPAEGGEDGCGAEGPLRLVVDPGRRRLAATVDMGAALRRHNVRRPSATNASTADEAARVRLAADALRQELEALNADAAAEMEEHLRHAIDNCLAGVRYERLAADGPHLTDITDRHPLFTRYFTFGAEVETLEPEAVEALIWGEGGARVMAHNGWVMAADPLSDFAAPPSDGRVYLRRELIAWGDSVKLRYGDKPEDSPFLWAHMREYVELTAELFDGLRLDNCHSTPLHVAEYLLDCARNVKPELYVIAELFTNSDHVDNIFVNRLGITSLIREAQAAWDAHEQGRLLHRFGARPVGAFLPPPPPARRPLPAPPLVAHALLMDLTHDNPSPLVKRCVYDTLPTAAMTAMGCCATGSTRGLDELVPHQVHVVDEERLYPLWGGAGGGGGGGSGDDVTVTADTALMAARRLLNELHAHLALNNYTETFVDQMSPDVVAVTRHDPITRKSVILVAATAFRLPEAAFEGYQVRPLRFEGVLEQLLFECRLRHRDPSRPFAAPHVPAPGDRHPRLIAGLTDITCDVRRAPPLHQSQLFAGAHVDGRSTELRWRGALPPGAVVALRVAPHPDHAAALRRADAELNALAAPSALEAALRDLTLPDYSAVLFRCNEEERDATRGEGGVYDVPGHGPLVYAGLQGAASLLAAVRATDNLGHPLCANLRAGDWLADYTWRRLQREPRLRALAERVRDAFQPLQQLPRYLQPAYFEAVHSLVHGATVRGCGRLLAAWCGDSWLGGALALTSVQMVARVPSAPLPPLQDAVDPPAPSMSAGLPHFASGHMRCWGRDTFIALRGLLLLPGRAADARNHILGFGGALRHGLIPNLLDGGPRARYNCRDAVWWWLYSIKQYVCETEEGAALLRAAVLRLFPRDDSEPAVTSPPAAPLCDVMQEALTAHFEGRVFRERNAGPAIDAHMTEPGFTVQIGVRPDTGFVYGGNDHNAGTWMDKMGSSERAHNRGRPATPRDGSAVELVALSYGVVAWLADEHRAGRYPHGGVTRAQPDGSRTHWGWAQWADKVRDSFERHFWIPSEPSATDERPDLVHRRAIYKDTVGATRAYADYQLRCNYVVAMAVAPDLFVPKHAWLALDAVERHLLGPLGLKTLDPADWAYRPDYDNANDSDDPSVAHGFNYHQGPEWLWPLGFYLRARLHFGALVGASARTLVHVLRALGPLQAELATSPWRGLPELSNAGGAYCAHSCRSQAWSSAVVLEVLSAVRAARRHVKLD